MSQRPKMVRVHTASVPCGGCTLCCRNDMIVLHPECGDNPADWLTEPCINPVTGAPALMLAKKPGSADCVYLGEAGCTIHGKAPAICREFDCGRFFDRFMEMPRAERRRVVRKNLVGQDVIDQGRRVSALRATGAS